MEGTPHTDDEEEQLLFSSSSECNALLDNVDLVLPSATIAPTSHVVVLLCYALKDTANPTHNSSSCNNTNSNNNNKPRIEQEEEVCKLEVSKVIFESKQSNKKVLIFQCKTGEKKTRVCLKLMNNNSIYQMEKRAYEEMHREQAALFLPVYFFCEVIMPDNCVWKGYCMKEGQYSMREILCSPPSTTFADIMAQRHIVETILKDKETFLRHPDAMNRMGGGGGEPVVFQEKQSIQMSLIMAMMRLLHRMHTVHGWVHGDSHLGNFMYHQGTMYAIDFERSFATDLPVQHLLDLQECFGHFSGMLLSPLGNHEWDMRDIFGVYYHRHPLLAVRDSPTPKRGCVHMYSRRSTLFLLPVCTCFTCPTKKLRLKGCVFCKSALNQDSSKWVAEKFEEVLEDIRDWGITKLKNGLALTRSNTVTGQCTNLVELIYPCIQDGIILVQKMGERHPVASSEVGYPGRVRLAGDADASSSSSSSSTVPAEPRVKRRKVLAIDEKTSVLDSKIVMELTKSRQSCMNVLKRLLYMPIISLKAKAMMEEIVERLHYAGFAHAAKTLWSHVALK